MAHVCDVYNSSAAECRCPTVDHLDNQKVCGYVTWDVGGSTPRTWKNAGQLKRYACTNGATDFTIMNEGECGSMKIQELLK